MNERLKRGGGPAFPLVLADQYHSGMSLRDDFAGQALAGLLAFSPNDLTSGPVKQYDAKDAAEHAYRMADAMIEARKPN